MEDKTYTYIFNDILSNVLHLSENPSQFAEYLTHQIRELIGARTIVIAIKTETDETKIFSVFPVRKKEWANQSDVMHLAEMSFSYETIQFLDKVNGDKNITALLQNLEIDKVIAIPLIAAGRKMGSILLLDIMDLFGIESVIELLTRLSGVFALVIRNSNLYKNMETLVAIRTAELQNRNKELVERNAFIQKILDNLPIGLALNKFDEGSATYMNRKFEEIYGWSQNEITSIDTFFRNVYPDPEYRRQITERVLSDVNSGDPEKMHWENIMITCKDGSNKIVNAANISLIEQNMMVSTVIDMTSYHQIQNDLMKSKDRAEESDRLKSAFLANMSHEIRTPMNGILGFAEILKEPNLTSDKQLEFLGIIEKSGVRMLNIINDIIDISKIESGQMKAILSQANVNEQIDFIYSFFRSEVEQKGIKLYVVKSLPSLETNIITDREKLYAILTNLVKNAIKYTKEGFIEFGYYSIGAQTETIRKENEKQELLFFVRDSGIGIPENRQQAIFERFIQAEISDKMARQGAGLGLAISKAYVEMLDGKIWVESEEGKGSVFYFTIPYNQTRNEEIFTGNENLSLFQEPQEKKLTVLIAEDDLGSANLLEILVKKFGCNVMHVKTGTETVEACRNYSEIDLVLMDIQMPELDGYEATRQIRKFNSELVIIAQTAYALSGDREKAIEAGCSDYISKPIKQDHLKELIHKHFIANY